MRIGRVAAVRRAVKVAAAACAPVDRADGAAQLPDELVELAEVQPAVQVVVKLAQHRRRCRDRSLEAERRQRRAQRAHLQVAVAVAVVPLEDVAQAAAVAAGLTGLPANLVPEYWVGWEPPAHAASPGWPAQAMAAAHAARHAAADRIRYQLLIESMPSEELPPLEKERINRMLSLALNTERLKERHLNASALLNEVNTDFARTMSSIIFHRQAEAHAADGGETIFSCFRLPPHAEPPPAPWSALVAIPAHECLAQKRGFAFHTFLSKKEIILGIIKVRTECNKALQLALFNTSFTKSVSAEEFEQAQAQALRAAQG